MNYNFELRKDKINKDGLIPIRMVISHGKIRIRKNIEAKCLLEHWNADSNIIISEKKNKYYDIYQEYNSNIVDVKNKVEDIFKFFQYNKIEFQEDIFLQKFEGNKINVAIDFFEAFDEFINVSKLTKAKGTVKKYNTVKNFLLHFKDNTSYPVRFDTINLKFEERFMDYCFNERLTLNNYYGKLVSIIKTFMQWSFDRQYHSLLDFKRIKRTEDEIEVIYLNIDELMELYNHKFKDKKLERSRDFFCFGCFTGLRQSDIRNLGNANLYELQFDMCIRKTRTIDHSVPLNKFAREILDKYKGTIYEPIPIISSQKLNKNIQDACAELEWFKPITRTRYIGSKTVNITERKCDIITSHVARKTFISNSIALGMNERILRKITDSKDEKSFRRYVKIEDLQKQKEMNKWDSIGK